MGQGTEIDPDMMDGIMELRRRIRKEVCLPRQQHPENEIACDTKRDVKRVSGTRTKKLVRRKYKMRYSNINNTSIIDGATDNGSGIITKMAGVCFPRVVRKVTGFDFLVYILQAFRMFRLRLHLSLYYRLPFNVMSRAWGSFNSVDLPKWLRGPTFRLYGWLFQCDLQEAMVQDLKEYKNLSEFFRRKLRPELRPINPHTCLISPVDGRILHYGRVESGHLEQVKGVKYTMQDFLGPKPNTHNSNSSPLSIEGSTDSFGRPISRVVLDRAYQQSIKEMPTGTELFYCIIYLAPGDYHCFHSPTDWQISYRRHFPGRLMSVRPSVVQWVQGLFALNERVVYFGKWCFGFFSMTPVGATNVGSIRVFGDQELRTNTNMKQNHKTPFSDKAYNNEIFEPRKGDLFGEFNLGSTVVLIFEAPKSFSFINSPDGRVQVGQALGRLPWEF